LKKLLTLFILFLTLLSTNLLSQKRYGLIIGVDYKGNTIGTSELNLCEADAKYMQAQIQKHGNFTDIKMLMGKDVTKANIEKEIKDLGRKATANDVVFLFFAGHGYYQRDAAAKNGMKNYIVCFDRPHLSDDELNEYLKSIKTSKTVFAFDCCYSGGIAKKGKKTRGDREVPIPTGSNGVVKQGRDDFFFQDKVIISSADDSQTAIEVGGNINHGIFTYHFGRAMESADLNGDKIITALEAFHQTRERVMKTARDHDHEQEPQISGNASGISLSGEIKPNPAPVYVPVQPEPNPTPVPNPEHNPPKPDPVKPVVTPDEPAPVVNTSKSDFLIRTSIIKDRRYGVNAMSPQDIMKNRNRKGDRKVKVLINDAEYPFTTRTVKSDYWGGGTHKKGDVYHLLVKNVPKGVHKITVRADDYPEQNTTFAVTGEKDNVLDLAASMSGFGAIQGQVFFKTLDNPVSRQNIYMPTIKSVNGTQRVQTDKDGNFWFTNLLPGEYEIRASFAENLPLSNSMIKVKEGEITKVQVILNVKLPGTRTKY
jgi:hypothetical protein